MHHFTKNTALCAALLATGSHAFVAPSSGLTSHRTTAFSTSGRQTSKQSRTAVYSSPDIGVQKDNEIERLRSMAAKLRAEAAELQAEKAQELADAAEKAFRKFDSNQDGTVSVDELKEGLEKKLKTDLPESRVNDLMQAFDTSGDGELQLEEFVSVDQFRNKLDALARDEKERARQEAKQATIEAEETRFAETRMEILNDKAPSNTDKLISVLPYLLPLVDVLQFGRTFLEGNDNPVVSALAVLFTLYRSVPFGGIISYLVLSVLSDNPSLNRQVRFNMQQSIFLDFAMFLPSLLLSVIGLALSVFGSQIPSAVTEISNDAIFVTMVAALGYSVVSSLLGVTPDKVPFISNRVSDRMLKPDMFDEEGRFIFPRRDDDENKDGDK